LKNLSKKHQKSVDKFQSRCYITCHPEKTGVDRACRKTFDRIEKCEKKLDMDLPLCYIKQAAPLEEGAGMYLEN
jgi:hypothetical protein